MCEFCGCASGKPASAKPTEVKSAPVKTDAAPAAGSRVKIVSSAATAGLALLAFALWAAPSAWAQCQGGCCGGAATDETPQVAVQIPIEGITPENAEALGGLLTPMGAVESVQVGDDAVTLTLRRDRAVALSQIERALEGSDFSVRREDLRLNGGSRVRLSGMTCEGCVAGVRERLDGIEGLADVSIADPRAGMVEGAYEDVSLGVIEAALDGSQFALADVIWGDGRLECCGRCGGETANPQSSCCGNCGPNPGPDDCCGQCGQEGNP